MGRKKSQRMFTREQRKREREAQLERARQLTPEQVDRAIISAHLPGVLEEPSAMAESWLLIVQWGPAPGERELLGALGRHFERLTGHRLNRLVAEDYTEAIRA